MARQKENTKPLNPTNNKTHETNTCSKITVNHNNLINNKLVSFVQYENKPNLTNPFL